MPAYFRAGCSEAVFLEITNVAKLVYAEQNEVLSELSSYPVLMSPWPYAWFEFRLPSYFKNDRQQLERVQLKGRMGAFVQTILADDEGIDSLSRAMGEKAPQRFIDLIPEGGYLSLFTACLKQDTYPVESNPLVMLCFLVDKQGALVKDSAFSFISNGFMTYEQGQGYIRDFRTLMYPFFQAISLCHCKNIRQTTVEPDAKVQRKRARNNKPPLVTYRVLEIEPTMTRKSSVKGAEVSEKTKRALHITRGHFATYTPDAPLFGKVTGTFWKPMHVKGNRMHGEVKKDYAIATPPPS